MNTYFESANLASTGIGLDAFRHLFSESCGLCMAQYENFAAAAAQGQSADGAVYETWSLILEDRDEDSALVVSAVDTGQVMLRAADGTVLEMFPAESGITTAWSLQRDANATWLLVDARDLS